VRIPAGVKGRFVAKVLMDEGLVERTIKWSDILCVEESIYGWWCVWWLL